MTIPLFVLVVAAMAAGGGQAAPNPSATAQATPQATLQDGAAAGSSAGAAAGKIGGVLAGVTTTPSIVPAATGHAWMDGERLLVSGAALGLRSEKEAKLFAVKDAASSAAEFLDGKQIALPALVRRAIEDNILRETPIAGADFGDLRIEDLCQERWRDENGLDRWSMTLTLSLRVGKGKGR
jgi:hypothetical protein